HVSFGHYVEPVASYFQSITHAEPKVALAIVSTLVVISCIVCSWYYYLVRVHQQSPAATELANGLTARNGLARGGYTVLYTTYYLDYLYTDVIVGSVKGPIADAAYWTNQNIIDGVVNEVGHQAVNTANFVYGTVDQGLIDRTVNTTGVAAEGAGETLRHMQDGKVQHYAAIMFAAAAVIAGILVLVV
ncbi:MAG: hypothetical protein ACK5O2_12275, partial [Microthrixaceae bacterium]